MIERILLDGAGAPLLNLFRDSRSEALLPLEESMPDLMPVGRIEEVTGTGVKIYVGADLLTSGSYTLTLGTYGRTHADNFNLQRAVMQAAVLTRAIQRNGSTLPIARFAKITRILKGGGQFSGRVTVEFVPATPYWLADSRTVSLSAGTSTVQVGGMARCPLRVTFTGPATNPSITTDAGVTTWLGTVPSGQKLVIDARPGIWAVTLNGNPQAALALTGPQPYLEPGARAVTLTHAATLDWREGVL